MSNTLPHPFRACDDQAVFEAVAAYWEAKDALEANGRERKNCFRGVGAAQRSGRRDVVRASERSLDDNGKEWGAILRGLREARDTLADLTPQTFRGAVEMMTVALDCFSEPFDDGAGSRVFSPAVALEMIRRARDAIELWETNSSPLLDGKAG